MALRLAQRPKEGPVGSRSTPPSCAQPSTTSSAPVHARMSAACLRENRAATRRISRSPGRDAVLRVLPTTFNWPLYLEALLLMASPALRHVAVLPTMKSTFRRP